MKVQPTAQNMDEKFSRIAALIKRNTEQETKEQEDARLRRLRKKRPLWYDDKQ